MWQIHSETPADALRERNAFLRALARESDNADFDRFAAQVIFTELVGNAARHARGPVDVQLQCEEGKALLHVYDRGNGFVLEPGLPSAPLQETGRGLYLVSHFAESVKVNTLEGHGTCVSVVFDVGRHARAG